MALPPPVITRRSLVAGLGALVTGDLASGAGAQTPPKAPAVPVPPPAAQPAAPPPQPVRFSFEEVLRRARDLAGAPFDAAVPALPEPVAKLDFDAWRDIRFRPDRALLGANGGPFRLQAFHVGHLYKRPVTVNVVRDGLATPIPYAANLFDFGRTKIDKPLPVNLGFAGFRLHYPLNDPKVLDEVVAFVGASYFRFLGRRHRYGLSARGLAIGAGGQEEFPFFREFWVETPEPGAERVTIYALLDSESLTGAYRFDLFPATESFVDVSVTLFARRPVANLGLAPLTSMFFSGENDRRLPEDFRPELHDSDGLLIHSGTGEWIWRPLRNPAQALTSAFLDKDVRGFGLMQRDRVFEHYQDLDLGYELRPSYWIAPREGWGEGRVELVELPTTDETNDNIVASWAPKDPIEPGKPLSIGYRITAIMDGARLSPGGRAINTYRTVARALGSAEAAVAGSRRFIIDFAGGELPYYLGDPSQVEVVPSTANGRIMRAFLVPNHHTNGFRAGLDVLLEPGQSTDLRAFLKAGSRTLTETWTYPWKAE